MTGVQTCALPIYHEGALKESDISESDLPPRVREIPSLEEVVGSDRVGCHVDVLTGDVTLRCPIGTATFYFISFYFILFNSSYYTYFDLFAPTFCLSHCSYSHCVG